MEVGRMLRVDGHGGRDFPEIKSASWSQIGILPFDRILGRANVLGISDPDHDGKGTSHPIAEDPTVQLEVAGCDQGRLPMTHRFHIYDSPLCSRFSLKVVQQIVDCEPTMR